MRIPSRPHYLLLGLFRVYLFVYPISHKDPRGGHNRAKINRDFFKKWSAQMAYVLGFIYADGAIEDVQKSSRTCYIQMTSKDLELLKQIQQVMGSENKVYERHPRINRFPNGRQFLSSLAYNVRIGNKLMYNDLLALGVTPRKSLTILFPNIPSEYLEYFLRGYFDGDGCIQLKEGKYPVVVFTSGSIKFLEELSRILSRNLNIQHRDVYISHKDDMNLCYQLAFNTTMSKVILRFMYMNLSNAPYLGRKYEIYKKYLERCVLKKSGSVAVGNVVAIEK